MRRLLAFVVAALLAGAPPAGAAPFFNGFDLANFKFDVTSFTIGPGGEFIDSTASGTSNGVGWTLSPTSLWSARTITDQSFSFAALGGRLIDNLHPGQDYTITFDQPVKSLLVALSNDNTLDSVNFGRVPTFTQGVSVAGTQITLQSAAGGLAWFDNVNSLTISNVNNNGIDDGYDLAFHVISTVPEADGLAMLIAGLGVLAVAVRRRGKVPA